MHSINYQFRASYFSVLAGNIVVNGVTIPFNSYQSPIAATPTNPDNYVLINYISSTNVNDTNTHYLIVNVFLKIVTKAYQNNAGAIKDEIANQIYNLVYPTPNALVIQIPNGQVFDTKMGIDIETPGLSDGEKHVVNRDISFRHWVKLEPNGGAGAGNIYYGVQLTSADPTNFSNSLSQDGNLPISVDYGNQDEPMFYWLAVPSQFLQKENWDDLNDEGNSGSIGAATDLYEIRALDIEGDAYTLYMTRYLTGWNEPSSQVKYYN